MKILETKDCEKSPWFRARRIIYKNRGETTLSWDYIERTGDGGSVIIVPKFRESGDLLLIRQYRIIFGRYVIGFPAGIVDKNETVEETALRELREETGYRGKIMKISPDFTTNSALIRETACCILVEIEEECIPVRQELEESEKIEVFRIKQSLLSSFLEQSAKQGDLISAGPWFMHMAADWLKDA